jgi:hypothetical protein
MTTGKRLLVLAIAMATALAFATTATAKKPTTTRPSHPDGMTCAQAYAEGWRDSPAEVWDGRGTKTVTVTYLAETVCIDLSNDAPATFTVSVNDVGATELVAGIRDSHPGDFCAWYTGIDLVNVDGGTFVVPEPGNLVPDPFNPGEYFAEIPAATVNACGDEYNENGVFEVTDDPNPLVLVAWGSFRGKSNKNALIEVTFTSSLPPLP